MKVTIEIIRGIRNSYFEPSRLRLGAAFVAGIITMAILAQIPAAGAVFMPQASHESTVPAAPDTADLLKIEIDPDDYNQVKSHIYELV